MTLGFVGVVAVTLALVSLLVINRLGGYFDDQQRAELLDLLRDYEALDQDEKTINVHVSHLRDKLEDDPTHPAFVQTIRGVGYAFAER